MKLFLLRPNHQFYGNSMALRALLFSTQALSRQLKRMVMQAADPMASVVPILESWVQQGNEIEHSQLQKIIRDLPRTTRSNHALQISQWMGDRGGYELSAEDFALQLELTSRVTLDIEKVETYFDAIPKSLRGYEVYRALLRSYANLGCLEKGEATMQKLRELGFARDALDYNVMLSFYYKIREYDKMNILAEEMREKGVDYSANTYSILLRGNCDYLSIKKMEEVLRELEADPLVKTEWCHYLLAAEGYWKSQAVEMAFAMLKKSEESIESGLNGFAFESLVALYGVVGSKADVYRLWSLHKPKTGFYHRACYQMCRSLIEVGDTDGAKRIWKEWFSRYSRLPKEAIADMNVTWEKEVYSEIPRVLINRYRPEWEKSEAIVSKLRERGIEPDADTLDELADVYCECKQMDKAVETLMEAISVSEPGWKPKMSVMGCCLDYLECLGDDVRRKELSKILMEHCGV